MLTDMKYYLFFILFIVLASIAQADIQDPPLITLLPNDNDDSNPGRFINKFYHIGEGVEYHTKSPHKSV
ncbi:hypothetical protein B9Z55_006417 [Caenorhabditis nigoni]|uniref:Uncharacterized protein n=1 Tax=Caenorhabditis nigoni TaxID=1611254 RepID=A0A2G5V534_9PELO|nr:hypothetical protein B9Z55_006417 [Caenorhabditis nigoni]